MAHLKPPPELTSDVDPLPVFQGDTMNDLLGYSITMAGMYNGCKIENNNKAKWIRAIYK